MTCPNSDPNFDKMLGNFFDISSPKYINIRTMLFYFVCIWVRYAIYSFIYFNRNHYLVPIIVGLGALFSIFNLTITLINEPKTYFRPWWSKTFQLINAIILVPICILVYNKMINSIYIPLILFVSLFGGILQSLFTKFC
jgi:hypothetical protein